MKRIEFLAPVEAMRGNLSGSQKLTYPTQDNSAWDAPSDRRSYATNYNTRYVGSKRSKDGLKYFSVRQRSAVNMTPAMRQQMALLSVSSVIANLIPMNLETLAQLQQMYALSYEGQVLKWTFKRWIMISVRTGLSEKNDIFFNATGMPSIIYKNPYKTSHVPTAIDVPQFPEELLVKFWMELADNPITFTVAGQKGIAHATETFSQLIASNHNTLNLSAQSTGEYTGLIMSGDLYLCYDSSVEGTLTKYSPTVDESINPNIKYYLDTTPGEIGG